MDLHEYTYDEASALFGSSYSDIYDNSILWTDTTIDIFLGKLLDWGLFNNTLIVIASDHGEAFRERGHEGHARFVFKEETEVPLVILFPFRLPGGGIVVHSRTRNVDIWPTIYDLLGFDLPDGLEHADGVSLVPEILAAARRESVSADAASRTGFAHLLQGWGRTDGPKTPTYALASRNLRYVAHSGKNGTVEELYDSNQDPDEMQNLASDRPDVLRQMRSRAEELARIEPVWGEPEERELNELELNQLRALGYSIGALPTGPADDGAPQRYSIPMKAAESLEARSFEPHADPSPVESGIGLGHPRRIERSPSTW